MRTSSAAAIRRGIAVSSATALLLLGASPAYADTIRSRQWYLDAMQAEQMWELSTGENVTVAVIDSGVDASIPDLKGRVLKGLDLAKDSPGDEHTDYRNHGTGMASIIAGTGNARGGGGSFGLAPGAKILPIRLRDNLGKVNGATADKHFNDDLSMAIRFAVDHGAKIINASIGKSVGSQQLTDSVKYALGKGALIFAAVGNSADKENLIEYPAGTPGVVGVGAIGKNLHKADFSQYGSQVDLSAPGVDMVHGCSGGTRLCKTSGTSDATAVISASAALIWSKYPDWTNNQVLRALLNTAGAPTSGALRNDYVGYGAVRPRIPLKAPGDPGPADEYPLPDLAAAASPSPSPSAQPSKAGNGAEESDRPSAGPPVADGQSDNTALWMGLGILVAALAGAVVTFVVIRSRRRQAAASAPPPHQPPYAHQPPPYAPYTPPPGDPGANSPYGGAPNQGGPTR
ncbi:type VII secretion-associated serine protease mycosin [Streptomyces sp. NBC_00984]|uniref:type VII secretion-associated serine protease mycosin n=1 Tax=Streptomyces sp. NBC_00984 TaxID=2903700 RepID=UPI00386632D8|nr:type VII secretion-associated serine protease mycosin [Streptomyces sp. NBC_00984]